MEEKVRVRLIGRPAAWIGDQTVRFPYRKTEGIFYYLCVEKQVNREALVSMFWPETDDSSGRKNLRQVLYQLKKILGEDILIRQGNSILQLNPERSITIDWDQSDAELIEQEGEFLEFFYIRECPDFDRWIDSMRERFHIRCQQAVHEKLSGKKGPSESEYHRLIGRMIQMDPLSEGLVQKGMEEYAAAGLFNPAIQLFYDYRRRLAEEMDEDPGDDICRMLQQIFRAKESSMGRSEKKQEYFFGRFHELQRIEEEIRKFRAGEECVSLVIQGDMGVGKTQLAEKALGTLENCRDICILRGHANASDHEFILRSWNEIFRDLELKVEQGRFVLGEREEEIFQHIVHGERVGEGQAFVNQATYPMMENRIVNLFRRLAGQYKLILMIDDLQWMDYISLQLVERLLQEMGGRELFILATLRKNETPETEDQLHWMERKGWVRSLDLAPFSRDETFKILQERKVDKRIISGEQLYTRSEGNALIMMDILEVILEEGKVPRGLPSRTGQMVALQLRRLDERQLRLLQAISIYMESADIEELQVLIHEDVMTIYDTLDSLQRMHLVKEMPLEDTLTYAFSHRAYRDYVYEHQTLGKRRLWHKLVAEFYEERKNTERWFEYLPFLIYQYERCGESEKAQRYRVKYYCEFFALANENFPILQNRMNYDSKTVSMSEGVILEQAERILKEESTEETDILAECHFLLGRAGVARGNYEDALVHIKAALALAGEDRALYLGAIRQMIFYGIQVEDTKVMEEYIRLGMERIKDESPGSDYATLLRLRGMLEIRKGDYSKAEVSLNQAIKLFMDLRNKDCKYNLSRAACYHYLSQIELIRGQKAGSEAEAMEFYKQAEELLRKALEVGQGKYPTNGMAQIRGSLGYCLLLQGRLQEAEAFLREAVLCFRRRGFFWGWGRCEVCLASLLARQGLMTEAKEHLHEAEIMIGAMKNPSNRKLLEECREQICRREEELKTAAV